MYSTSLTYTLIELIKNTNANVKIYWITASNGKNIKCHDSPTPPNNTKITIMMQDIKKLINPAVTDDIGNISRGKYTFFIKFELYTNIPEPWEIQVVNQVQGIIPHIKKIR